MPNTLMGPQHEPKPFISNRLALLCTPGDITTATGKSAPRKPLHATTRRKARKTLEEVLDLPLDVVFEIASHLTPVDLLNLARTSLRFRATFMSKTALGVWKRVLERIPDLPECPRDLTHPQYASLIFEKFCMVRLDTLSPLSALTSPPEMPARTKSLYAH
ncbi:unnamed protein product [Cyclocybe aegerita]|uniref:F-box domain-containing protein n=1 Tax=Cyclocybe aegerita TaxID=1973307 RepID=A0A8S0W5M9_CYCAE|nr:unnamed protein product [Cyclocybe aegerita]